MNHLYFLSIITTENTYFYKANQQYRNISLILLLREQMSNLNISLDTKLYFVVFRLKIYTFYYMCISSKMSQF